MTSPVGRRVGVFYWPDAEGSIGLAGTPLVLRGLWWRRGLTGALLVAGVVTTTSAALGPLYARAAGESILQDHLRAAGSGAGLHLSSQVDVGDPGAYATVAATAPKPGSVPGYRRLIRGLYTPLGETALATGSQVFVQTALTWRDGACRHLVIVRGRCPSEPNEAATSQRAAGSPFYGFTFGNTIALRPATPDAQAPRSAPLIRIVGVYRPKDPADPFWFDQPYFDARIGAGVDTVDALFVTESEFRSFTAPTTVEADFDYPLTPAAIRLRTVAAERAAVKQTLATYRETTPVVASSGVLGVLTAAARERQLAQVSTLLVTVQLALLAWLVLFKIVTDAIEARGNEIAMAKLRGLSPGATVRFGFGEPVAVLAVAVPLGVLAALGATHVFAASVFVAGVPVVLPASAVVVALLAFVGGLVAAGLAGYRTLTRSILDQWRRTDRAPAAGRPALAADVVVATAAIAGLILLRRGHRDAASSDTAVLLAPGLLVAAVGILGVRLLPLLCRRLARLTRASRQIAVFLASRQVARRPVGLRLAALLAVAGGLAMFAVAGESVATGNRAARAQAELGAARVASVQFDAGVDPVAATADADPSGRWAMAAATWLPDGGDSIAGTVLGVDSSRLSAVSYPAVGGPTPPQIGRTVGSAPVPPIRTTAAKLRVHVTAAGLAGDERPYLELNLRTPHARFYNVDSGTITDGAHAFVLPVSCAEGCLLLGVTWNRPVTAQRRLSGTITLRGVDVGGVRWRPLDIGLQVPGSWRAAVPQSTASDDVTVTPSGVRDAFANDNGGYGGLAYASAPSPIPALATARAIVTGAGHPARPQMQDNTGTTAYFRVVQYAPVLPVVLDDGVVMDVGNLNAELPDFATEAQWQVWLGPAAPPDAVARLNAAGLYVEHVHTEPARVHQLGRQGPALALLLLLVCAVAGAVLAVGGTAISISATSRRRSYEIAALRAVGVPRGSLFRASVVEQLLLLGTAVALGPPSGLLAARLAMPVIPEFADATPIALHYAPSWAPTLLFLAIFTALVVGTAFVAAHQLIRVAAPARLREAEG